MNWDILDTTIFFLQQNKNYKFKKKFTKDKRKIILYMPTLKKNIHGSLSSLDFFIKNQKNFI